MMKVYLHLKIVLNNKKEKTVNKIILNKELYI